MVVGAAGCLWWAPFLTARSTSHSMTLWKPTKTGAIAALSSGCVRGKWPHARSTRRLPKVSGLRRK